MKRMARDNRFIYLTDRAQRFRNAHEEIQTKVKKALIDKLGQYENVEDDAWFIVSGFRRFAHLGGAGFTEKWPIDDQGESGGNRKPKPPSTRQCKKDFEETANALQKAWEKVESLTKDALACEAIAWALLEATETRKELPRTLFLNALSGINDMGHAIQKVLKNGNIFKKQGTYRDIDAMRRNIVNDVANIYYARHKTYKKIDLLALIDEVFTGLNMSPLGEKTIKKELEKVASKFEM